MSGPQVYLTKPPSGFFPESLPRALPPPANERSFRAPFGIDPWLFDFALKPEVPITFALLYVFTVLSLNAYNTKRNFKPWSISKSPVFQYFVVTHNAVLTLYSAATFFAMARAAVHTWPGLNTHTGLAGVADAMCKMHGPRGLGDAATYNTTINIWEVKNSVIKLGYNGTPNPSDVGRLWNEGLAFWGWMFYVSKFYEVLDTLIILAKGKRSATLQTYHHSGAMLCMWAGMRYMSPPIWMFVFVNSFIHALMYTYYSLAAMDIKVPIIAKRALTSLQIAQLVWGSTYAAAHLFIKYDIPVSTSYQIASTLQSVASSVSSAASAATSTISKVIESPAAAGTLVPLIKKLLLRAVGEEGIAERVTNSQGKPITPYIEERIEQFNDRAHQKSNQLFETRWRTDYTKTHCIDTSGEAFAIYLNLLYFAPLTFLFARFFVRTYTGRGKTRNVSHAAKQITDSGKVARDRTEEAVERAGRKVEDEIIQAEAELQKISVSDIQEQLRRDVQAVKNGTWSRESHRVSDHVQNFERQVRSAAESVKESTMKAVSGTGSPRRASPSKRQQGVTREEQSASKDEGATMPPTEDYAKQTAAKDAVTAPQASSESKQKQEQILEASAPIRPGVQVGGGVSAQPGSAGESEAKRLDGVSYAEAVQLGPAANEDRDFGQKLQESTNESQGASVFGLSDDSDAMGKSGAIVDYAAEKAEEVKQEVKKVLPDGKPSGN